MDYIDKIDLQRVTKKMSIRALGLISNIPETTVKSILSKRGEPRVASIDKICSALGFSLSQLFCEKDEVIVKSADMPTDLILAFALLSEEAKGHVLWLAKNLFDR